MDASGLTKAYGSLTAVDALDLTVPAGQILALLGRNGAGKSTTTEMVLGLTRPDAGAVTIFGAPPIHAVRGGVVGAMLQNGVLLPDTSVRSLLGLMHGLHVHPMPIADVIEFANLRPILRSSTSRLSGGEAQRVRFALAVLPNPRLLLLDEPTAGMDPDARRHFWSAMDTLADDQRTIVFATHYLDEADEFADRIVVLDHGRIVADGNGAQIKATVGGRVITFSGRVRDYASLPGVHTVENRGERHLLHCTDSDATLRALLTDPTVTDVEVVAPRLEDAFLELVS
jgi:ABC-2 type transport system ATP-binding protein